MENAMYELEMKVRDYECDLQGIVNNAVYQNYLSHARHEFLRDQGIDFAAYQAEGKSLIVTRIEMDIKKSLCSGDTCIVKLYAEPEGKLRIAFFQNIYRKSDEALVVQGKVTGVCLENGRPMKIGFLMDKIKGKE